MTLLLIIKSNAENRQPLVTLCGLIHLSWCFIITKWRTVSIPTQSVDVNSFVLRRRSVFLKNNQHCRKKHSFSNYKKATIMDAQLLLTSYGSVTVTIRQILYWRRTASQSTFMKSYSACWHRFSLFSKTRACLFLRRANNTCAVKLS